MISSIVKQLFNHIQDHWPQETKAAVDFPPRLKTEIEAILQRAGLISRKEFDKQTAVLQRTQAKLATVEQELRKLEKLLDK